MKTDNSNIVVEDLDHAVIKYWDSIANDKEKSYMQSFKSGANWQKEQYKTILESHAELLDIVKTISFWFGNEANYPIGTQGYNIYNQSQQALGNVKKLNNQKTQS